MYVKSSKFLSLVDTVNEVSVDLAASLYLLIFQRLFQLGYYYTFDYEDRHFYSHSKITFKVQICRK